MSEVGDSNIYAEYPNLLQDKNVPSGSRLPVAWMKDFSILHTPNISEFCLKTDHGRIPWSTVNKIVLNQR
jgi:hypothetical protein